MAALIIGAGIFSIGCYILLFTSTLAVGILFILVGTFVFFYDFDSEPIVTKQRGGKLSKQPYYPRSKVNSRAKNSTDDSYKSRLWAWLWTPKDYTVTSKKNHQSSSSHDYWSDSYDSDSSSWDDFFSDNDSGSDD